MNLAAALAAALVTAVLTGGLLVGDSVRGSLRQMTLDRLGGIDLALVPHRFFREDLAAALENAGPSLTRVAPVIRLAGAAENTHTHARAAHLWVHGIDARFLDLLPAVRPFDLRRRAGQTLAGVVLNRSLAGELGAREGDETLISFARSEEVPADTLAGSRDPLHLTRRLRLVVIRIMPDQGPGAFGLAPHQGTPLNAFIDLAELQRALGRGGQVNGLFATAGPGRDPDRERILRQALRLEDLGLHARRTGAVLSVESGAFVIDPGVESAIQQVAEEQGMAMRGVQTYLANRLRAGPRQVAYSTVSAVSGAAVDPFLPLRLVDGTPAPRLADDEILINIWAAEDLHARAGDEVEMSYYVLGPGEELRTASHPFRLRGIVTMEGLGADRTLTPDYPGIHDARDISAWDPPFPVDLNAISDRDEEYWDRYRATPKAFVAPATARRLWGTRYGSLTSLRIALGRGPDLAAATDAFTARLRQAVDLPSFGFRFRQVKSEGLAAASGATDFSQLFLSFSFFLILSAALVVGLLFRLNVERRGREIGLLLAVGYRVSRVRRRLLAEGLVIACLGGVLGVAGGAAYAAALMAGLHTLWRPAVGSSRLFLHVAPSSLFLGWVLAVAVVLATGALAVRRLVRLPPPLLLAGATRVEGDGGRGWPSGLLAYGGLAAALGLAALGVSARSTASPALAFGTGAALLASALAWFGRWCRPRGPAQAGGARAGLTAMAARNSAWNPGRSILCVALVGCASFIILMVATNFQEQEVDMTSREGPTGGFSLMASTSVPLHHDLNRAAGRAELGLDADADSWGGVKVFSFGLLPGQDASCLNLYQPTRPAVLGVPPEMVARGGFRFTRTLDNAPDGWALLERDLGPGVIPALADASSAQWILHKGLGDEILLEDGRDGPVRLRLVGLLQESVFQSQLLVAEHRLLEQFPGRAGASVFLVETPADRLDATAALLESGLGRFGMDATRTDHKLAAFRAVQNTYLATFQALGALGLLLGTIGLGVVLLRNVLERRRELAVLRAFGYRPGRIAALVLLENGFLLAMGVVAGGLSALLAVAPRLAGGAIHPPWLVLGATLAAVLLVGLLSSLAAVIGMARLPLLPVLKAER